jgi:hypothetical protein
MALLQIAELVMLGSFVLLGCATILWLVLGDWGEELADFEYDN